MNNEIYSKVIDQLLFGELDYKKIVIELAKKKPEVFLDIVGFDSPHLISERAMGKIVMFLRYDQLTEAIRVLRDDTQLNLQCAKDVIFVVSGRDNVPLQDDLARMSEEIKIAMRT